jgi:hypothetical protein
MHRPSIVGRILPDNLRLRKCDTVTPGYPQLPTISGGSAGVARGDLNAAQGSFGRIREDGLSNPLWVGQRGWG